MKKLLFKILLFINKKILQNKDSNYRQIKEMKTNPSLYILAYGVTAIIVLFTILISKELPNIFMTIWETVVNIFFIILGLFLSLVSNIWTFIKDNILFVVLGICIYSLLERISINIARICDTNIDILDRLEDINNEIKEVKSELNDISNHAWEISINTKSDKVRTP